MRLKGGLERIGRVRVVECLRQTVLECFCVYTRADKGSGVGCGSQLSCRSVRLKETGQILSGCARDGTEADSWNFVSNATSYWQSLKNFKNRKGSSQIW